MDGYFLQSKKMHCKY